MTAPGYLIGMDQEISGHGSGVVSHTWHSHPEKLPSSIAYNVNQSLKLEFTLLRILWKKIYKKWCIKVAHWAQNKMHAGDKEKRKF